MAFQLPAGLGSEDDLMRRFKKWKGRWELWRSLWQDAYDYALPERENFTQISPGQRKNVQVFDSTAVQGVQIFASRLQSAVIPPWQRWIQFKAGSDIPPDEAERIAPILEDVTDIVLDFLNHSDFYTQANESFLDLSVGTGGLMIEEGDGINEPLLKFTALPLSSLILEKGHSNRIQSFWREVEISGRNVLSAYPEGDFSQQMLDAIKSSPDKDVDLLDATLFNHDDGLYYQVVLEKRSKHLVFVQPYEEQPGVIFRWAVAPNEIYGRGPVIQALPDILTVNKVKEFVLRNAALAVSGVYTALDDGVVNPYTVRIAPGAVIPVMSNSNTNPSIRPLDRSGDFNIAQFTIKDLQTSINEALFAKPLGDVTDPVRSATENSIRLQEALRRQGASFGRMWTEFVLPVLERVVGILRRNGKLPDIRVNGRELTLKQVSPLAKAQNQEDVTNFNTFMATVGTLPQEILMGTLNIDRIPRRVGEALGIWSDVLKSSDEIQQAKQAAAQALAQQQQAEAAQAQEGEQ